VFARLIQNIGRWRWVEIALILVLVGVPVLALWLESQGDFARWQQFGLFVLGVGVFVVWIFVIGGQRQRLRILENHATMVARQEFDALYEQSPAPYLTIDTRGNIIRANGSSVHLLQDTIEQSVSRNLYDFITDEETGNTAKAVLAGKVSAGLTIKDTEMPIVTIKGERRWVLVTVFAGEHPDERLVSLTDITEQRAVDTAKSEFVALATHQLRTPIAAIRWNVDLLGRAMKDSKTEKQAKYLTKVERNTMRMLNLINDFLSVSKLEMGTYAAEPEVVEFSGYLAGILDEFEEKITTKQLTMNQQLSPAQFNVAIDRRLFHIISSNLLSNAVKYTPAGGQVHVTAQADNGTFYFTVADSGIGIPKSEQAELFSKFFRASNAKQQVTEGTGLGLYVVKQSVEILGGTLTIESAENKGTTFQVQLPGVVR